MKARRATGSTLAAYLALALTWGASFLLIKTALQGMSPGQVVLGRLLIGAVTLMVLMAVTRRRWPRAARLWGHLALVGLFLCVLPFLLFAWAGEFLPSGLSAILNATTPIMTMLVTAAALPQERLTRTQAAGVLLGAAGVAVVVGPWRLFADPAFLGSLPAQLACLAATACYGIAFTYLRRFVAGTHKYDALAVSAVQVSLAAAIMLLAAPLAATGPLRLDLPVAASIVLLGAFGTGFAYIWNTLIVERWGGVAASTVTYLTPLTGVVLGALVLGESLHWNEPAGGVVVVLGILASQGRFSLGRPGRRRAAAAGAESRFDTR